jgi:transcriptional regulator with XRE-family HTH domain
MLLGDKIKKIRQDLKLSQEGLATKIKIHTKQLAKYESNRTTPSIDSLIKIAKFSEVTLDYLVFGEDKNFTAKTKINDTDLLELFRRINQLKKSQRDKIKWALEALLEKEIDINQK